MNITLRSIAVAHNSRKTPEDDHWDRIETTIRLVDEFPEEALAGLDTFSHLEILFFFHLQDEAKIVSGSEHPRENPAWPKVGIFAQRKKARPNRLGATVVELVRVAGRELTVRRFDGIDGTPILDIKPVMHEYLPRGEVRQPEWSTELMREYW